MILPCSGMLLSNKNEELLIHEWTTHVNIKIIKLSEGSKLKQSIYCLITCISNYRKYKLSYSGKKQKSCDLGVRVWEWGVKFRRDLSWSRVLMEGGNRYIHYLDFGDSLWIYKYIYTHKTKLIKLYTQILLQ